MNIYLLRHGETDWNIEKRFQGRRDIPMNANGVQQIERSAQVLASLIPDVDVILSSPLVRAKKTAEIAADRLGYAKEDIVIEPMFIERGFGEAEGVASEDLWNEEVIARYAGVESLDDLCERAKSALEKVTEQYAGKTVLVAAHGAILRAVLAAVLGRKNVYEVAKMKLESGCVHLLKYEDGAWSAFKCDIGEVVFKKLRM